MLPIANGSIMAALQASTPPDLQGRLFSLVGSVESATMPLGLIIAGPLSDRFGANIWFLVAGFTAIALGSSAFFIRAIFHLEQQGEKLTAAREAAKATDGSEASSASAPHLE